MDPHPGALDMAGGPLRHHYCAAATQSLLTEELIQPAVDYLLRKQGPSLPPRRKNA